VALGLVFHELATNAAKYGGLTSPVGHVHVTWRLVLISDLERRLVLQWREAGGPPVRTPTRRGFGSRLIETSLRGQLGGAVQMAFEPEGFSCRLEMSLSDTAGHTEEAAAAAG
jgi:two-component sensor histidine kinase